jgi:hypothetical protein
MGSGDTNGSGTSSKDKDAGLWTVADRLAAALHGNRALAGLAALLAEVLFGGWFLVAGTSAERIVAGLLFAIVLLAVVYLAMRRPSGTAKPGPDPMVLKVAKQLSGGWTIDSHPGPSSHRPEGVGKADIRRSGPGLSITGNVDQGADSGFDFSSEAAWIKENELVFCYTFQEAGNRRRALTVLRLPSEPHPTRLEGTWFVAGHAISGKVVYTKPAKPPSGG